MSKPDYYHVLIYVGKLIFRHQIVAEQTGFEIVCVSLNYYTYLTPKFVGSVSFAKDQLQAENNFLCVFIL